MPTIHTKLPPTRMMEDTSPLWQKYLSVEYDFVTYLASLKLRDPASCDLVRRSDTNEAIFVLFLGQDALTDKFAVAKIELHVRDWLEKHFSGTDAAERLTYYIIGSPSGKMGALWEIWCAPEDTGVRQVPEYRGLGVAHLALQGPERNPAPMIVDDDLRRRLRMIAESASGAL